MTPEQREYAEQAVRSSMRRGVGRIVRFFVIALMCLAALALFGFVAMKLWNWLTPALFGWRLITYWQALGLLILTRLLFGRWGGPARRGGVRGWRMRARWESMTPEEREKFREAFRGCWDRVTPPDAKPTASS
jgi:hypothetical protein